jgi:hypothetical protein
MRVVRVSLGSVAIVEQIPNIESVNDMLRMTMMIECMIDVTDAMDVMNGCMPGGFARTEG